MTSSVIFTIDNLGDAADLHRGVISTPRDPGNNPALESGYPALLDLFADFDIPLTCFVEGWSAQQYRDQLRELTLRGHEIGMHGWQHENWSSLTQAQVLDLSTRATRSIREATGKSPLAFRAPGGSSSVYTRQVLADLGYHIDASHNGSDSITREGNGLLCIPYNWEGVDAFHWLWNKHSTGEVEQRWQQVLARAAEENRHFVFIWHPHVMGISTERLECGRRLLEFVSAHQQYQVVSLESLYRTHVAGESSSVLA